MFGFIKTLFGDSSSRYLKSIHPLIGKINALEDQFAALTDDQLAAKTQEFKQQLTQGKTVEDLLVPAFAAVREAAKRALGLRIFDTQLLGGITLHQHRIAEMKTGEGKTLVATLPAYLNAISGKGVHVVTVNDYLAKRDAAWMGQVFARLGLTTSAIFHGQSATERKQAYLADITYATNNELGFDYLRDNMTLSPIMLVQRPLHFAIVDEVDSILIDEARTPLIISGPADDKTELYQTINALAPKLKAGEDYEIDEKQRSANLTEAGTDKAEDFLREAGLLAEDGNLYDVHNVTLVHHVTQALRAHVLFRKDVEYIIKPNEQGVEQVVLIDEFTGRMMPGRRLSEGLHQAIEAKEGVPIQQENQTMASITFQNYFRLYPKLAGMTGTALTEEEEFQSIYNLSVVAIPTNKPVTRNDESDFIFRTAAGKLRAIVKDVKDCHERGQPVLVGTVSIEKSEELASKLREAGIPHQVLNARYHEQEAQIIAQAGRLGAVTIATNMAGRGTDIKLGGNLDLLLQEAPGGATDAARAEIRKRHEEEHQAVMEAGGLRIIGTERHESRRIDNQLRGRSGRQGDVGSSAFYISLQDDLIKRFAPSLDSLMARLNMPEDEAIQHPWIAKSIETAQRKIEGLHFDVRKHVIKFDDVLNEQRKVIYSQRQEILHAEDLSETIRDYRTEVVDELLAQAFPPETLPEQWQPDILENGLANWLALNAPINAWLKESDVGQDDIAERVHTAAQISWEQKLKEFPPEAMRNIERTVLLQVLDRLWRQHLQVLDYLRRGINLRGYAQKDPINEFATESYMLFEDLLSQVKKETIGLLARVRLVEEAPEPQPLQNLTAIHPDEQGNPVAEPLPPINAPQGSSASPKSQPRMAGQGPQAQANPSQNPQAKSAANNGPTPQQLGLNAWDEIHPLDPRLPRNALCPCGSGERFKRCHGNPARLQQKRAA